MEEILQLHNTPLEAKAKRYEVGQRLKAMSQNINCDEVTRLAQDDLEKLLKCYDQVFFNGWLQPVLGDSLKLSLSRRMSRSAGITLCPKNFKQLPPEKRQIEIRLSVDMIFNYDALATNKQVGGIEATSALEALQLVFEHELCHVLEFLYRGRSSCGGSFFKALSARLFDHQGRHHQLPTGRQIARERHGIVMGDKVRFAGEAGDLCGTVTNITKRATVMVPDKKGNFADSKGRRYTKYYVPLDQLSRT